ncbi:ParB N-terminal domain-containing protein [Vreelandella alkaliphila]|uniref:ParB N-terminal domain-containing protein n=1 Tax=Vreelandella alkaliphila TaxID=272774 RepID=UPI0039F62B5B
MAKFPYPETLNTSELSFDPENPRFPREISAGAENVILEKMIRDERVAEIMQSIGVQGYFEGEPLLVVQASGSNKYYVVEGNRRLAALKLLNGELETPKRLKTIFSIIEDAAEKPTKVPCIVFSERKDILRYLGFRHITGIKAWGPLAKARYLKQLREDVYAEEPEELQLKMLAKEIGSRSDYVGTMLTGLELYDKAKDSEFFNLPGITEKGIEFTLLTTAIGYRNISDYLGLESKVDTQCENVEDDKLKDVFSWIYSQDQQGNTIVSDSRKLKDLAAVVANQDAVSNLKKKGDLNEAFLMTEGPQVAFTQMLEAAKKKLNLAYETLPSVSDVDKSHEDEIQSIFDLSKSIRSVIKGRLDDE